MIKTSEIGSEQRPSLTFVQMGDYAEAFQTFEAGGKESYFAQKFTVDFVGSLLEDGKVARVNVISALRDAPRQTMSNGVETAGVKLFQPGARPRYQDMISVLNEFETTHAIVALPQLPLLRWALGRGYQTLPLFADSFRSHRLRDRFRYWRLARLLNDDRIPFVANHNIAASRDLQRIGVRDDKVLPFDWPALVSPLDYEVKTAPKGGLLKLAYVGQLSGAKGVGDAIEALALLKQAGTDARLTLVGRGDADGFMALAQGGGVGQQVTFTGLLPHDQVLDVMRRSDMVLVPSHHDYPEGLPMTLYEAMCTRTPLIASDHPMFRLKIRDGENALVFPAAQPKALAATIERLAGDATLYEQISNRQKDVAEGYLCPLKWPDLLSGFLDPAAWPQLRSYSLAAHDYGPQ